MSNKIPDDWDGKTFLIGDDCALCFCYAGMGLVNTECDLCRLRLLLGDLEYFLPELKKMGFEMQRTIKL